jgi:hypothetical protein
VNAYENPRVRPIASTLERFERNPEAVIHLAEHESRRAPTRRRQRRARWMPRLARAREALGRAPVIRRGFGRAADA